MKPTHEFLSESHQAQPRNQHATDSLAAAKLESVTWIHFMATDQQYKCEVC